MPIYVYPPEHRMTQIVRRRFRLSSSKYYVGWSDDFDEQFDSRAVLFAYSERPDADPLATFRIVHRAYGGVVGKLPVETGDISAFVHLDGDVDRVVEGTSLCYAKAVHGMNVVHGAVRWFLSKGLRRGYVIHDPRNKIMRRFHLDLLGLKLVPNAKVIFGSFKRRRTLEPVEWHVAQGDEETFANAVKNLEMAGAVPVPIVEV